MTADIDGLMRDFVGGTSSSTEVETMVGRLEKMLDVKHADMFEGKAAKAPANWPETAHDALIRLNFNENSGSWSFGFVDKSKIIDIISRLKGLYKNEDVVDNPLGVALSRVPREDLKEIGIHLKRLIKDTAPEPVPAGPIRNEIQSYPLPRISANSLGRST